MTPSVVIFSQRSRLDRGKVKGDSEPGRWAEEHGVDWHVDAQDHKRGGQQGTWYSVSK